MIRRFLSKRIFHNAVPSFSSILLGNYHVTFNLGRKERNHFISLKSLSPLVFEGVLHTHGESAYQTPRFDSRLVLDSLSRPMTVLWEVIRSHSWCLKCHQGTVASAMGNVVDQ